MKKTLLLLILCFGCLNWAQAQIDPHFSQYYANPLWLNPALTGVIDGDLRVNGNFKNQWGSLDNGYKTGGMTIDYRPTNQIGIGLSVTNQSAGTAGYNYLGAYGSFGYGIQLSNEYQWLNFGVQAGIINRSVDRSKFQSDSQYDPSIGYNPNLPLNESMIAINASVFDAGAGIFYHDDEPYKTTNFFAGASAFHLSRPKDPFEAKGQINRIPIRFNIHGGLKVSVSDYLAITPHVIYIKQNKNDIKGAGAYSEIIFENDDALILGGMYRLNDAAVANIGFRIGKLSIGANYDFNTSALNAATYGRGGLELSLSYTFGKGIFGAAPVCPRF